MRKIALKFMSAFALVAVMSVETKAQNQPANTIPEITIRNNDGFNKLRGLLNSNFDYTNPKIGQGTFNSVVEFDLAEDGKITNVIAKGDCPHVSGEIVETIKNLLYKVDVSKLKQEDLVAHYKMPIVANIN